MFLSKQKQERSKIKNLYTYKIRFPGKLLHPMLILIYSPVAESVCFGLYHFNRLG